MITTFSKKLDNITLTETRKGRIDPRIQGTYVHPILIPHIATWASMNFAFEVSQIVNEFHRKRAVAKQQKLLDEKEDKIDILIKENQRQTRELKKLQKDTEKIIRQNETSDKKIDRLHNKMDIANDKKVVPIGKKEDETRLIIINNNSDNIKHPEYSVFHTQDDNVKRLLSIHEGKYEDMHLVVDLKNPNAMNLWKRVKNHLKKNKRALKCSNRDFDLSNNYTETQLIKDVKRIHNERFDDDGDSDNSDNSDNDDDNNNDDSDDD
jgi:hypothetical protein